MSYSIEKEYKMILNKESFDKLFKAFDVITFHTNYYYKCEYSNIAIRIREINSKYYFTMKVKQDDLLEYEFEVAENSLDDNKIIELFKTYDIKNIKYLGILENTRLELKDQYGIYCLDHCKYLDSEDYEIEYELFDHQEDRLSNLVNFLSNYGITYKVNEISKFKRFLIRQEEIK